MEDVFPKSFSICQSDLNYLESIDKNTSAALRKLIDIDRKNKIKVKKRKEIDSNIMFIGFGTIIILLGFTLTTVLVSWLAFAGGVFFMFYGFVGGLWNAIQVRKTKQ